MTKISDKYAEYFDDRFLMGPNSIYLLEELLTKYPVHMSRKQTVLDLGCGKGLTSLFLAREVGASVYANDLWVGVEDNLKQFIQWGIQDVVIPSREDANHLSFEPETFDGVFSVDAYHYFAGKKGFFEKNILPLVKKGGIVLISVPGIKDRYEGRQKELLGPWLGEEAEMLRSPGWWRQLIGEVGGAAAVDVWEMDSFHSAWESWLSVDNKFAAVDKLHYESIIEKYTDFVGIAVKKY